LKGGRRWCSSRHQSDELPGRNHASIGESSSPQTEGYGARSLCQVWKTKQGRDGGRRDADRTAHDVADARNEPE
jgi:hypothetical protein